MKRRGSSMLAARVHSPAFYTAVVIYCNTGLRNAELRRARWSQVDFLKAEFQVGKSKTAGGEGRIIPLNQAALGAFKEWRSRWPDAKPEDYIFPTEKLAFKGAGAPDKGVMTALRCRPRQTVRSMEAGMEHGQETGRGRVSHSRSTPPLHFGTGADADPGRHHSGNQRPSQPEDAGALQPCAAGGKAAGSGGVGRDGRAAGSISDCGDSKARKLHRGPHKIPHKLRNGSGCASVSG